MSSQDEKKKGGSKLPSRQLGVLDATMIVMGSMIGSGVFITSAESSRLTGAPGYLLLAWLISGLMTISGAVCAAEIAAMMPRVGGQYVFLRTAYSPAVGFLFGWAMFLVVQSGTIAAVAVAFAKFLGVFLPAVAADNDLISPIQAGGYALSLSTQQLTAVGLVGLLTLVNMGGLSIGKWVQNTFTFTKTAALLGLIVLGLFWGWNVNSAAYTASWWDSAANGWSSRAASPGLPFDGAPALVLLLGMAMIGPLFSQSAWNNVTFTGGEVKDPGRTFPIALLVGTLSVVVLYVLANLAYLVTLSFAGIAHAPNDRVGTAALEAILGAPGAKVMAGAILISTFGCVNGLVLAGARIYYAMARDGLFFRPAALLNRRGAPAAALAAQGLWAAFLTLPVTAVRDEAGVVKFGNLYNQLLEYVIPVDVMFYSLMVGSVVAMRIKAPWLKRPYRTIAYPLPAVIYIGLAVFLAADFIYMRPSTSGMGFLIVLAGLPVYWAWSRSAAAATSSAPKSDPTAP